MNKLKLLICTLFAFFTITLVSCDPTEKPDQNDPVNPDGPEIDPEEYESYILNCILDPSEGSIDGIDIIANRAWKVENPNTQISISPMQGDSGAHNLRVTALQTNEELIEAVYQFSITGDDRASANKYFVVQRATKGLIIDDADMTIGGAQDYIYIPYKGNYSAGKISCTSSNPACEFLGIDTVVAPAVLIEGKKAANNMYSVYTEGDIIFQLNEQNLGTENIEFVIEIKAEDIKYSIKVTQLPYTVGKPDFSREFFRTSVIYEVGGTDCGNCPVMQYQIYKAKKEMPGRLVVVNCQFTGYDSDYFPMYAMFQDVWATQWRPSAYFNNYAYVHNFSDGDTQLYMFKALAEEAISEYPSNVGISAKAILSEDQTKMDLDIHLAAKTDDKAYFMTIFILEDDVWAQQSGAESVRDPNFDASNHQGILRECLTGNLTTGGDWIMDLIAEDVCTISMKGVDVPENILNIENMRIAIIITTPGYIPEDKGLVGNAKYNDYGFIVDNAALFPINGAVEFKYE